MSLFSVRVVVVVVLISGNLNLGFIVFLSISKDELHLRSVLLLSSRLLCPLRLWLVVKMLFLKQICCFCVIYSFEMS